MNDNLVQFDKDEEFNKTGEVVLYAVASWDIALEYGGELVEEPTTKQKTHREILAEQRAKTLLSATKMEELN